MFYRVNTYITKGKLCHNIAIADKNEERAE